MNRLLIFLPKVDESVSLRVHWLANAIYHLPYVSTLNSTLAFILYFSIKTRLYLKQSLKFDLISHAHKHLVVEPFPFSIISKLGTRLRIISIL